MSIKIKESKKGTFTAAATKHHKGVQEFGDPPGKDSNKARAAKRAYKVQDTPIYSGGVLPEFTVIANKKGSDLDNEFRLMEYMQNQGLNKQVYDLWKMAGKPKLSEKDRDYAGTHSAEGIELPTAGKFKRHALQGLINSRIRKAGTSKITDPTLNIFLSEIPHALQSQEVGEEALSKRHAKDWKKYGEDTYYKKGTVEYDAHMVREPAVRKQYDNTINNKKVQHFINGGDFKQYNASKWRHDFGGLLQSVAPLADLAIPGVGTGLSLITSLLDNKMNKPQETIYNKQLEMGGQVNGFKQYNAPTHEEGGQLIDENGESNVNNPVAEIEGNENSFRYNALPDKAGKRYVFSDANGTSQMVRDVMKKYKNKDTDNDLATRASMEMDIKNVENINEALNAARQNVSNFLQKRYGGEFKDGGRVNPLLEPISNPYNIVNNNSQLSSAYSRSPINPYDQLGRQAGLQKTMNSLPNLSNPYDRTAGNYSVDSLTTRSPINPYDEMGRRLDRPYEITETKPDYSNKVSNDFYTVGQNGNQNNNVFDNTSGLQELGKETVSPDYGKYLRGAGIIASGIDAFQKPTVEETILPDYSKSDERMSGMSADLTQARQDVLAASNRGSELNRGAASSYSQYRSRELSNIGNLQDQLGRIGAQEQQMRNQILGAQGQYEANKATTVAGIKDSVQQRNLANVAKTQDLRKQFFADVVHEGDRLSTIRNNTLINDAKVKEGMEILKLIAPDFQINEEKVTNLMKVAKGQMSVSDLSDDELILFNRLNSK